MTPQQIPITGDMIRLGQLLKLAGVVEGGGEAKALLAAGAVRVNGEAEARRGRQLHPGDVVAVDGGLELAVAGGRRRSPPLDPLPARRDGIR